MEFGGGIVSARIHPKAFAGNETTRNSTKSEILVMLTARPNHVAPLTIIYSRPPIHAKRRRVPETSAARMGDNNIAKSHMRVRGCVVKGGPFHNPTSTPTEDRVLVRLLVSQAVLRNYDISPCDIRRAFLQADSLAESERYIAVPPACVRLYSAHWDGPLIVGRGGKKTWKSPFMFCAINPSTSPLMRR